jgi:spore coat polysaccharide biosynthesis protein SpsF
VTENAAERIGIVMQVRMGSTRLPGKVLMPLGQTTLLGWIVQRIRDLPWTLVVATSDQSQDDPIADNCECMNVSCFRGSELDVLDRYYQCAVENGFSQIVRLTGDNPFPDKEVMRELISLHLAESADYSYCLGELPVGTGSEVISVEALETSWREGRATHHREHVNEYILEQPYRFQISKLEVNSAKYAPTLRLTIDTKEDYERIYRCVQNDTNVNIGTEALIERCSSSV